METAFVTEFEGLEVRQVDGHHELVGLAVPYGRVTDKTPGRKKELFRYGAFASATGAAGKVRLIDENHDLGKRPAGVAIALEERDDGLFSRWRFYDTPEGRAAYENAREGTYGGLSVGFAVPDGGDRLVAGVREIHQARLHHVSLVDEPAYDDARILSVRSADLSEYSKYADYQRPELEQLDDTPLSVRIRRILA